MPTYEYGCTICGHKFEAFQRITAEPLTECPSCGGPVERIIGGGTGFIFKGSGFYKTDHRSDSYKKAAAKDKAPITPTTSEKKTSKKSVKSKD